MAAWAGGYDLDGVLMLCVAGLFLIETRRSFCLPLGYSTFIYTFRLMALCFTSAADRDKSRQYVALLAQQPQFTSLHPSFFDAAS